MVEPDEVRDIAAALPGVTDDSVPGRLVFSVAGRGVARTFMLRVHPKKPRVPDLPVLAVRCPIERKDLLVEAAPDIYFDDDHYRGFPAVLVRLEAIEPDDLSALLAAAAAASVSGPKWSRKAKPPARRGVATEDDPDRTTVCESVHTPTLKLVSDVAGGSRPKGSAMTVRALLATALLLGVLISLALPTPGPRKSGVAVIRPGATAP